MIPLPPRFFEVPIAHRGFHGAAGPENGWSSFQAAIDAGYGIELDLQLSSDGCAMVFHDETLDRMTDEIGLVRERSTSELASIRLADSDDRIDTLGDVLDRIDGRVPVLIELKDQSGVLGPTDGALEAAVADVCKDRTDIAVMSFNPHMVAELARLIPDVPRGITTSAYAEKYWSEVPADTRDRLRGIPDADHIGASFISHEAADLDRVRVAELKARGLAIFCWTIRSADAEAVARKIADNVTFEGYEAVTPLS